MMFLGVIGEGEQTIVLTQKGYGYVSVESGDLELGYDTVTSGSAPSAGDLVVWHVGSHDPLSDITGSGWTQNARPTSKVIYFQGVAKVIEAGDISAPPVISDTGSDGGAAFWIAYSVAGSISSLTIGGEADSFGSFGGSGASDNLPLDLTELSGVLIASSIQTGSDGSVDQGWTGATSDFTNAQNDVVDIVDYTHKAKMYAAGVSGDEITSLGGTNGGWNGNSVFYLQVE